MSKLRLDQIETLDEMTTINVADLAATASDITTATGMQSLTDAIDNRVAYQDSYTALIALNTSNFTSGQQFVVKGTPFRWNGTAFKADGPINVETFGATGDGTTDDSAAIQAAIDFAEDGDEVYLPSPEVSYLVTTALNITNRIQVRGDGSKITTTGAIVGVFNMDAVQSGLEGILIEGDRTPGQRGIRVSQDYVAIRDCDLRQLDMGIEVWGGVWQRLEHIRARNISDTVLEIGNVVGTVVEDFRYDTDIATYSEPTQGIYLWGEGCNLSDLDFIHAGKACRLATNGRECKWHFFNSCSFDTSTYGLVIENTDPAQNVFGIMFDHCWFASHSEKGAWIKGNFDTDGITFNGCTLVNNQKGGAHVEEASNNVEFKGCTFSGNSQASAGTYPHIRHQSVGTVQVLNSTFSSWGGFTNTASSAIQRDAGASYIIIDGCYANSAVVNAGLADSSSANPLSIGTNYGLLPTLSKQKIKTLSQAGSSNASGDITFAHGMPDAWAAIAQMDPASGAQVGVRSVDSTNVVMRVTSLATGDAVTSSGPWNITVSVFSQGFA